MRAVGPSKWPKTRGPVFPRPRLPPVSWPQAALTAARGGLPKRRGQRRPRPAPTAVCQEFANAHARVGLDHSHSHAHHVPVMTNPRWFYVLGARRRREDDPAV